MIKITPILVSVPQVYATHILIKPDIKSTTDTNCDIDWQLFNVVENVVGQRESGLDANNNPIMIDVVDKKTKFILKNNIKLTEQEYELWADDNTYIEDLVLTKLGLTRWSEL